MTKRAFVVVILAALGSVPVGIHSQSASSPELEGVWQLTERTLAAPAVFQDAGTNSNPQPGLWIFTAKHWSQTVIQGDKPRPELPPGGPEQATADQLRATWGPFVANAGTYELGEGTHTLRDIVSKAPARMRAGRFVTQSYKLDGDTLIVTGLRNDAGPVANPTTFTFTRLEGPSRSASPLQGVWRIVERTTTGPNGATNRSPQPGIWIITGRHFSWSVITGDTPLPDLPDPLKASADQLRRTWVPVTSRAGTYELSDGNLITFRASVAKGPEWMKPGAFATWSYKLEDDNSLVATSKSTHNGPATNPTTIRFTRLE